MSVGSVGNYWNTLFNKPAQAQASQEKKKTFVTNYVKGSAPDVSLPRVAIGGVAPFVLGRDIIKDPDIMWYGNLKPILKVATNDETTTDPTTGDETITTTVTTSVTGYTIDIQYCLGLGPGMRLRSILLDNRAIWSGTVGPARATFNIPNNAQISDVIFAGGNFDQAVDVYLQAIIPQQLPAYRGIAYIVLKALDTSKLGNISFEVDRYPDVLGLGAENKIGDDINPASAIAEVITRKWGGAGRDPATIGDSFMDLAAMLFDEANGCSIVARNVSSANDINGILLDQVDATLWEDHETGKIEITPYRKDFEREALVRVFDKDILKIDEMGKPSWQSIPTSLLVNYVDRAQNYSPIPLPARNLASSDKISKSIKTLDFPAVRVGANAANILAREGSNSGSPVQLVTITTNRKTAKANPGDVILITCEKYNYYSVPGIVVRRRTQPITDNSVTLLCNVILYPNNNVLFAPPEGSFFEPIDPGPHAPVLVRAMSAPWSLRSEIPPTGLDLFFVGEIQNDQMLILSNAYNAAQQYVRGYYRYGASDFLSFSSNKGVSLVNGNIVGSDADFSYPSYGKLFVAIDKYDNWDGTSTSETLQINNIGPQNTVLKSIAAAVTKGLGFDVFIFVGDEIFYLSTNRDPLTASFTYNEALRQATFTGVRRALMDTVAASHAVGDDVFLFTPANGYASKLGVFYGQNVDLVFTGTSSPKDFYSESDFALGFEVSRTGVDRANRPYRPHNTKINGARGTSSPTALALGATPTISWFNRGRNRKYSTVYAFQTDAAQSPEINAGGDHVAYRVIIKDSAAVEWDCGATANTADHSSLVVTVPLGAAPGVGWLWVQGEYNPGSGLKVSYYQDRLPITLS